MLRIRHSVIALCTILACGVDESAGPASAASVELVPSTKTLNINSAEQFSAIVRTAAGDVVANAPVAFNSTGGSIGLGGLYSAGSEAGNFAVWVAVSGTNLTDVSQVTLVAPPPPPPADFTPNRPVGMQDLATLTYSSSSDIEAGTRGSSAGFVDSTAPRSSPGVVRFVYPAGEAAGYYTGSQTNNLPAGTVRVYIAYNWRVSGNYTMHPANLKVWYFYRNLSQTSGSLVLGLQPGGGANLTTGPFEFNGQPQTSGGPGRMSPNVGGAPALSRGRWYHTEIVAVMNTDPAVSDGILRVWVDGVLTINNTNVRYSEGASPLEWRRANLDPYYGGNSPGHTIPSVCYLFVDHAVIATSTAR